jgi:hypothetical protein
VKKRQIHANIALPFHNYRDPFIGRSYHFATLLYSLWLLQYQTKNGKNAKNTNPAAIPTHTQTEMPSSAAEMHSLLSTEDVWFA